MELNHSSSSCICGEGDGGPVASLGATPAQRSYFFAEGLWWVRVDKRRPAVVVAIRGDFLERVGSLPGPSLSEIDDGLRLVLDLT